MIPDPALGIAWFTGTYAALALGAFVVGPRPWQKAAAIACSLLPMAPAVLFPPPLPVERGLLWLLFALGFMRMVDVTSEADQPLDFRLGLALAGFDVRDMTRAAPALNRGAFVSGFAWSAGFALAMLAAAAVSTAPWHVGRWTVSLVQVELGGPVLGPIARSGWAVAVGWPIRWLCGAAAVYCLIEWVGALAVLFFGLLGLRVLPLQAAPIRSRTLVEFWGRRWNREVGRWLYRWCFRPLAARGAPAGGVAAAFVFSGLFHGVAMYAALGLTAAGSMFLFFVVQGGLVGVERALGVARWRPLPARTWTIGTFLVTMPLFVEPALQLAGIVVPGGPALHVAFLVVQCGDV